MYLHHRFNKMALLLALNAYYEFLSSTASAIFPPLLNLPTDPFYNLDCAHDCRPLYVADNICQLALTANSSSSDTPTNFLTTPLSLLVTPYAATSTAITNLTNPLDNTAANTTLLHHYCLCNSPFLQPLWQNGTQCAFLCGAKSRRRLIDWLYTTCSPYLQPPIAKRSDIPSTDTFRPYRTPAKVWWDKYGDGQRFGIVFGIVLAGIVVWFFLHHFCIGFWQGGKKRRGK